MQRPFAISNLHNISLRGVGNKHDVILQLGSNDSVICERIFQLVCWTVLNVTNVSRISISNITVDVIGDSYAGILLQNCYDVEVKQCTVFSSNSSYVIGLYVTNGNNITADMIETKNMAIGVMIYQTNRFTLQGSNISLSNYVGIYSYLTTCTSFLNLFLTKNGKTGIVLYDCHVVQIVQVTSSMTEVGIKVWNCVSTIMEKMSLFHHFKRAVQISRSMNTHLNEIATTSNGYLIIFADNCTTLSITNISSSNDSHGILVLNTHFIKLFSLNFKDNAAVAVFVECRNIYISDIQVKNTYEALTIMKSRLVFIKNVVTEKVEGTAMKLITNIIVNAINISIKESFRYGVLIQQSDVVQMVKVSLNYNRLQGLYISESSRVTLSQVSALWNGLEGVQVFHSKNINIFSLHLSHNSIFVLKCYNIRLKNITVHSIEKNGLSFLHCQSTSLEESTFSEVEYVSQLFEPNIIDTPAVISSYNTTLRLVNCNFTGNTVSSVVADNSTIKLRGILVFENIFAASGAAFVLSGKSVLTVDEQTTVFFKSNHATEYGAAFYIKSEEVVDTSVHIKDLLSDIPSQFETSHTNCFLRVNGSRDVSARLTFINNTAEKGGDVLYGGLVAAGYDGDWNCLLSFKNISDMTGQSHEEPFRRITSEPSRVCLCGETGPDCLVVDNPTSYSLYPGETLTISIALVGQDFGTVSGFVHAQFLSSSFVLVSMEKRWVALQNSACSNVDYTIYSSCDTCDTIFVLSPDQKEVSQNADLHLNNKLRNTWSQLMSEPNYADLAARYIKKFILYDAPGDTYYLNKEEYSRTVNSTIEDFYTVNSGTLIDGTKFKLHFPQQIYRYPLYISIEFKPCPLGFVLSQSECSCNSLLKQIPTVECEIQTQTVSRGGSVWVGVYKNNTIAVSQYCPLNYCKKDSVKLSLRQEKSNGTDSQCNYNRSGVLCGECQEGLSLALGSEQCLPCSNTHLILILPFALAGLFVVFIIKCFDLTVRHGTINGMIFFANVMNANKDSFMSDSATNPIPLFVSWFNLDLGIETCFYDGLTAYVRTWLQFLFPFYIWSIAGGIIVLAKYSKRIAKFSGKNGVPVLATLFLLSYAKLLNTIISAISYTTLHTTEGSSFVWSGDGNIQYLGTKHAILFLVALFVLLFLWLPYTILLLFGRQLNKINCHLLTRNLLRLKPFLDANYAPLNSPHEYWFGVTLIVKATVLLASATVPANNARILVFFMNIACTVLLFWGHRVYCNSSILLFHRFSLMNLVVLLTTKLFAFNSIVKISIASYTLLMSTLVVFLALIFTRTFKTMQHNQGSLCCLRNRMMRERIPDYEMEDVEREDGEESGSDSDSSIESLPTY